MILSGLFSGPLGRVRFHGRAMALAAGAQSGFVVLLGVLLWVFASVSPDAVEAHPDPVALLVLCLVIVCAGACDNVAGIFRTTMMQQATPDSMRGRLQGLLTLVLTAGPRVGDMYAGFLAAAAVLWVPAVLGGCAHCRHHRGAQPQPSRLPPLRRTGARAMTDATRASAADTDRSAKIARLRELLEVRDAERMILTSAENLCWLFDGARLQVPYAGASVAQAVVERSGEIRVYALANEVDRLEAEELRDVPILPVPWSDSLPGAAPGSLVDTQLVTELRAARAVLLPVERARYAVFGAEMAHASGEVLRRAHPEHSERELAAALAREVVALGAEPVVLLVAGASRLGWRHPLPTDAPLGRRVMAVVGARRHGLIVNFTRWVRFGAADVAEADAETRLMEVEADAFDATRPGRVLSEVLDDIRAAYPRHGFDAEEWMRHHQGGPTGYLGRDPKVTPEAGDIVHAGQAFAWNPSAPGAKIEDTVIVDGDGIEVLTHDASWPTTSVRGRERPVELEL